MTNLEIIGVHNHGKADEEYLALSVHATCNLGNYQVIDQTYRANRLSNKQRHCYQFPAYFVRGGDVVLLFTGKGYDESVANPDGTTTHVRYMGLDIGVWNDKGDMAKLQYVQDVQDFPVSPVVRLAQVLAATNRTPRLAALYAKLTDRRTPNYGLIGAGLITPKAISDATNALRTPKIFMD
jgi:hypothetical protein